MTDLLDALAELQAREWAPGPGECGHVFGSSWPHEGAGWVTHLCRRPASHGELHECACGRVAPQHDGTPACPRCYGGHWDAGRAPGPYCHDPT